MAHHFVERSIIIIHDTYASPDLHWYAQVKKQLENAGYRVYIPRFPTPLGQSLHSWKVALDRYRVHITEETIIITHGIGAAFALTSLPEFSEIIRAVYMVAPYIKPINHAGFDPINKTFIDVDFDWVKIKTHARHFYNFYSNDDPYVPAELSRELTPLLAAEEIVVHKAGHFTGTDKTDFPELTTHILKLISRPELTPEERMQEEIIRAGFKKDKSSAAGLESSTELNTYYDELAEAVTGKEAGAMADILERQREKVEVRRIEKKISYKKILLGILSVIFLVAGVMGAKYFYGQINPVIVVDDATRTHLAEYSTSTWVQINNVDPRETMKLVSAKLQEQKRLRGTITAINFYEQLEKETKDATLVKLVQALPISVNSEFLKSGNDYMFGAYHDKSTDPFLIIKFIDPSIARTVTNEWEDTMSDDLGALLELNLTGLSPISPASFTSKVVNNFNLRMLTQPEEATKFTSFLKQIKVPGTVDPETGESPPTKSLFVQSTVQESTDGNIRNILSYAFIENKYLIITRNPEIIPILSTKIIR